MADDPQQRMWKILGDKLTEAEKHKLFIRQSLEAADPATLAFCDAAKKDSAVDCSASQSGSPTKPGQEPARSAPKTFNTFAAAAFKED